MQTFLNRVAKHIYQHHPQTLGRIGIIVPTRRAAYFLLQELANTTAEPVLSPDIMAVDDFVEGVSALQVEDPVHLLLELYETFRDIDPDLAFDRFMGWASVLLSDLDKTDQYMVDTARLFDYLSEAKALERWQESMPPGKKIENYEGTKQYFSLFENLHLLYEQFRARLLAKGKAYRGMAYRQVAEHPDQIIFDKKHYEKIYFAGFNAFTEAEKRIVQSLVKEGKAEVLWDTDQYYMSVNKGVEAGKSLREYQRSGLFGNWNWTSDDLLSSSKKVTVYGVPNATLQTKVAGQLYKEMLQADGPDTPVPTAIVLADENLLLPMLYSLDESITDLNVTMGLSMRNSLLYTLIDSIFDLQQHVVEFRNKQGNVIRIPKFSHKSIDKILNHPFIRHYEHVILRPLTDEQTIIQKTLTTITTQNKVFLSEHELLEMGENHPLFKILFTRWQRNNTPQVLATFYGLIDLLREVYKDYKNALETEYLYLFYTLLKQFEQTMEDRPDVITFKTLRTFMFELIRQTRIPFSGEPISNLQVLGMLETRALDFERVIILSLNEGVLPTAKRQHSLIPFDAAQSVGLPTHQHQEAVMSYHFYRLLQRASEVHILYTNTNDAPGGGEKSRFVQQVEYELSQYNPKLVVENKNVVFESTSAVQSDEEIYKDDGVLQEIRKYLSGKGLYPTHLNELIRCSMQFYLKHIVGVQEKEDVEEELGMDKIGTWIHASLERLDIEYFTKGTDPTEEEIIHILREEFETRFQGYVTDQGLNRIYYQIGEQQILIFLRHQMQQKPRRKILATEQPLRARLELILQGSFTEVWLGGKIDRIELSEDQTLLVMDYKTGSVEVTGKQKLNDPDFQREVLKTVGDPKMGYVRQLWLYEYLVYRKMLDENGLRLSGHIYDFENYRILSGFYSFRDPKNLIVNPLELAGAENTVAFLGQSEQILTDILDDLLDPEIPFRKTNDVKTCTYCDFTGICGR
ncbi:hypothetical protein DYBT9275_01440 [Dyadobacter sp. CECT 9275]|uniref:BRCT domain-containing protein n=1 Tax=Dyadobacter helix TaxID=2822344 RepID=A0A916NB46_9BACT|nr:PD-(D/E)XK nuclease family protein [Dyadobacter sp. CECT 9275]CAG4994662.1 hypothetical protein DYBT9275_01440 [Dyadobacter sp. CECT 9275]